MGGSLRSANELATGLTCCEAPKSQNSPIQTVGLGIERGDQLSFRFSAMNQPRNFLVWGTRGCPP